MRRQSILPRVYSVTDAAVNVRKPFKPPSSNGYSSNNEHLARRLWARKRFVPWGSNRPALVAITNRVNALETTHKDVPEEEICLPPDVEPLLLWQPEGFGEEGCNSKPIAVEPLLVKYLRPHQRYCTFNMIIYISGGVIEMHGGKQFADAYYSKIIWKHHLRFLVFDFVADGMFSLNTFVSSFYIPLSF